MVATSKDLFSIDTHVTIDKSNWFETSYEQTLQTTINSVKDPNNLLILTSAGMGAKILIADLHKYYPNAIIIDIGSALDLICSSRRTRDYHTLTSEEINEIQDAIKK